MVLEPSPGLGRLRVGGLASHIGGGSRAMVHSSSTVDFSLCHGVSYKSPLVEFNSRIAGQEARLKDGGAGMPAREED